MTSNFPSSQLSSQLTKFINELLQLKARRLDEILVWFEKRVAGVPRSTLLRAMVQYYYFNQFRGPDKIAERIILHFCIFNINDLNNSADNYNFAGRDQEINPSVAVLLKCYCDEYRRQDPNFAHISNAEKQFIGRLLGYTYEQRRLLLLDETPEKLSKVTDDDFFNCYIVSLLKRSSTAAIVRDVFDRIGLNTNAPPGFSFNSVSGVNAAALTPIGYGEIASKQSSSKNTTIVPPIHSSFHSSNVDERPGSSSSTTAMSPNPNVRSESQQAMLETAQTLLADYNDSNSESHFSNRTDSGVHDCDSINAESVLDELFNGSIKSLRHDEIESLKNYFEREANIEILKTYNITVERMTECVIAFPKMMGSVLALMLASNDERVYPYMDHMIHESFSAPTMVAMVQMFVESFKRGLQLNPSFVDSTLTCCFEFLDSDSAIKVAKSDDARIVRLVIYYIHIVVIYMSDAVSHRFGEMMNFLPNYSYIRTAPITYNKILQHQRKHGPLPSSQTKN